MSQTKFTPQLQDPNYVPSVRGGNEAGQEIEKLGRIGGDFLGTVVQIKDNAKLDQIKQEAESAAVALEAEASANFDLPGKAKERLNRLGMAGEYGTISEAALTLKATEITKELKGKFPGYEDIVDQEVDRRVFSGRRGRILQQAFLQLSEAERSAAAAQEKRTNDFKEFAKARAAVLAGPNTTDFFEWGGKVYDYTQSEDRWLSLVGEDVRIQRAQNRLTLSSTSHNFEQKKAADARDDAARAVTAALVSKMLMQQMPELINSINQAAEGGLTRQNVLQVQSMINEHVRQAELEYIQKTNKSYAEAAPDLAQIRAGWDGILALISDEKINHTSIAKILRESQVEDVFYAAQKKYPLLAGIQVVGQLNLSDALAQEWIGSLIQGSETGKAISDVIHWSVQQQIPASEALNGLRLSPEEQTKKMSDSAKFAKTILQKGLPTPDAKEFFIKNLSITAAGKATLGSDPVQGIKFLNSFYSGPNAKLVIQTLKEYQNDPSAAEQLQLASDLARQTLNHTIRQVEAEVREDSLLDAKGDLSKVFSYDEKSGTLTLEARRDKTIMVRGSGLVGTVELQNQVLKQSTKELQTAINVLNELGETKVVKDFLIQSNLIPDPEAKKETKGSM